MERRLDKIEKHLGGQEPDYGPILWVDVTSWPTDDQDAYCTGSAKQQEDLIERHCGRRPAATGLRGPIRTVINMPGPGNDLTEVVWITKGASDR